MFTDRIGWNHEKKRKRVLVTLWSNQWRSLLGHVQSAIRCGGKLASLTFIGFDFKKTTGDSVFTWFEWLNVCVCVLSMVAYHFYIHFTDTCCFLPFAKSWVCVSGHRPRCISVSSWRPGANVSASGCVKMERNRQLLMSFEPTLVTLIESITTSDDKTSSCFASLVSLHTWSDLWRVIAQAVDDGNARFIPFALCLHSFVRLLPLTKQASFVSCRNETWGVSRSFRAVPVLSSPIQTDQSTLDSKRHQPVWSVPFAFFLNPTATHLNLLWLSWLGRCPFD